MSKIRLEDWQKAIDRLEKIESLDYKYKIVTAFTDVPDDVAVDYWKDQNVLVFTRDGSIYRFGEKLEL